MGVTNAGIAYVLNLAFPSPANAWYVGLINNTPTPVLSATDTLASHAGWSEALYSVAYSQSARPTWTNGTVSSNQLTNSSSVSFSMIAANTIYGILLASVSTGTGGTLFLTSQFVGGPQIVVNTDTIQVTLTLLGASS